MVLVDLTGKAVDRSCVAEDAAEEGAAEEQDW
jgi:hypothetical protein